MMENGRSVRIFLSSTFRDFSEERDLLVKRVFPSLRARLRDQKLLLACHDLFASYIGPIHRAARRRFRDRQPLRGWVGIARRRPVRAVCITRSRAQRVMGLSLIHI